MTTDPLGKIKQAGEMRGEAKRLERESMVILEREIPRAVEKGARITDIARTGHVSRPTIYELLRRGS